MENKNSNKLKKLNKRIVKVQHRRDIIMALMQIVSTERRKGTVSLSQQEMIRLVLSPVDKIFADELGDIKHQANDLFIKEVAEDGDS